MKAKRQHLTAVVGVCDEVEIIGRCLDHLESQHVDSIVVVDMLSRDGTRELLRGWRDAGRIALIERDNDPNRDADYLMAGVEYARSLWNSTWILLQDADEFCLSASGDLHSALASLGAGVFQIPRFNACLSAGLLSQFAAPAPVDIGAIDLWVAPRRLTRETMDLDPNLRWSAAQPAPKVVASAARIFAIAPGGHAVFDAKGRVIPASATQELLVVHVPFLTFARFRKKMLRAKDLIANGRSYFQGATAWHWRRWIEILDAGELEEEYRRQYFDDQSLASAIGVGAVGRADALFGKHACVEA